MKQGAQTEMTYQDTIELTFCHTAGWLVEALNGNYNCDLYLAHLVWQWLEEIEA